MQDHAMQALARQIFVRFFLEIQELVELLKGSGLELFSLFILRILQTMKKRKNVQYRNENSPVSECFGLHI